MSEARREPQQPTGYIPKLTALSTAFPLNNEDSEPIRRAEAKQAERASDAQVAQSAPARAPHRHDAGE